MEQLEKEEADKKAEIERQREQQQRMEGMSSTENHDHAVEEKHPDESDLEPQREKNGEQSAQPDSPAVHLPPEPPCDTSQAATPGDIFKQENKDNGEEGPLGPSAPQERS